METFKYWLIHTVSNVCPSRFFQWLKNELLKVRRKKQEQEQMDALGSWYQELHVKYLLYQVKKNLQNEVRKKIAMRLHPWAKNGSIHFN